MKFQPILASNCPRAGVANGFLLALVAALAVGVGVTGTLLWTQSRAASPVSTSVVAPAAASNSAPVTPSTTTSATPGAATPPSIAGLTSAQAALTMGNWHYDQGHWPQAMASYQAAMAGGFDNPDVRTDYGNALRFSGQPQKALEQYQLAQKQNPSHEQSLFNQGGLWAFTLKNKPKALAAWRTYLKRFPNGQSAADARQFIKDNQ